MDRDLAKLYGIETKYLNRQVSRNRERFPDDFMIQLDKQETHELVTICHQFQALKHSRFFPYAFTEHGILMLSSVLNCPRAVQVNIQIMRTFIKLRQLLGSHKELVAKIEALEKKYDHQFMVVFEAIKKLMLPAEKLKTKIGFVVNQPSAG